MKSLSIRLKSFLPRGVLVGALCCVSFAFAHTSAHANATQSAPQMSYNIEEGEFKTSTGNKLKKVGEAEFSYLFWDVYDSVLFNLSGSMDQSYEWFEQVPLVLEIRYKRDIDAQDLIDNTVDQWQHLGIAREDYEAYVPWLKEVWPNLKKGDRLALLMQDGHSVFFYNQVEIARQSDPYFGRLFLDIWLSVDTSEPELRNGLLSLD